MVTINVDMLLQAGEQLNTFQQELSHMWIDKAAGNWAPRVSIAVDKYLQTVNEELNEKFHATAIDRQRKLTSFVKSLQEIDRL